MLFASCAGQRELWTSHRPLDGAVQHRAARALLVRPWRIRTRKLIVKPRSPPPALTPWKITAMSFGQWEYVYTHVLKGRLVHVLSLWGSLGGFHSLTHTHMNLHFEKAIHWPWLGRLVYFTNRNQGVEVGGLTIPIPI